MEGTPLIFSFVVKRPHQILNIGNDRWLVLIHFHPGRNAQTSDACRGKAWSGFREFPPLAEVCRAPPVKIWRAGVSRMGRYIGSGGRSYPPGRAGPPVTPKPVANNHCENTPKARSQIARLDKQHRACRQKMLFPSQAT